MPKKKEYKFYAFLSSSNATDFFSVKGNELLLPHPYAVDNFFLLTSVSLLFTYHSLVQGQIFVMLCIAFFFCGVDLYFTMFLIACVTTKLHTINQRICKTFHSSILIYSKTSWLAGIWRGRTLLPCEETL